MGAKASKNSDKTIEKNLLDTPTVLPAYTPPERIVKVNLPDNLVHKELFLHSSSTVWKVGYAWDIKFATLRRSAEDRHWKVVINTSMRGTTVLHFCCRLNAPLPTNEDVWLAFSDPRICESEARHVLDDIAGCVIAYGRK